MRESAVVAERDDSTGDLARYHRQIVFDNFGPAGQRALKAGRVLIIGVGGLGSWTAELLARTGVGTLRLVDDDRVDLTNIHRQALYDEDDARAGRAKVEACAEHLGRINAEVRVEPMAVRADRTNLEGLAEEADVILDGTDNFAARFLINDVAVKLGRPWVFGGVVGCEAQMMTIVPGRTACLRCVLETPPPACLDPDCRTTGVLPPAVMAVSAFQACEAVKILTGRVERISPYLTKFDMWTNQLQRIDTTGARRQVDCPCCKEREFEFLEP